MAPDRGLQGKGLLRDRPTLDLVVLAFTGVVAVLMVGTLVTIAVLEISDYTVDTSEVVSLLDSHTGTIIGALLGLIAGQVQGRAQARGEQFPTPTQR